MTRRSHLARLLLALLALPSPPAARRTSPTRRGRARDRDRVRLVLDYFPNADHAGIYAAQAAGEFAHAGLDVRDRHAADPAAPLKLLQAGRADLAISYEPELLLARDKGAAELVSVAALVQKPLTSMMSLEGKRPLGRGPAGKSVGTAGIPYQSAYLKTIAERGGRRPRLR